MRSKYKFVEHDELRVKPCTDFAVATEAQLLVFQAIKDDDCAALSAYISGGGALNIRHQWLPESWMPHDVDDKDEWNRNITPVHFATLRNRYQLLELLLRGGASPNVYLMSQWKDTPLSIAHYRGNRQTIKLLEGHGGLTYPHQHGFMWTVDLVAMVAGVCLICFDTGSDSVVTALYFLQGKYVLGAIGASIVLFANISTYLLLVKFSPVQHASASHSLKLIPVVPVYEIVSFVKAVRYHVRGYSKRLSENMGRHHRALEMLEAVLEAFPQLVLQVVAQALQGFNSFTAPFLISVILSLLSILKSICVYIYIRHDEKVNFFGVERAVAMQMHKASMLKLAHQRDAKTRGEQLTPLAAIFQTPGTLAAPLLDDPDESQEAALRGSEEGVV